jgi:hypothetical protein
VTRFVAISSAPARSNEIHCFRKIVTQALGCPMAMFLQVGILARSLAENRFPLKTTFFQSLHLIVSLTLQHKFRKKNWEIQCCWQSDRWKNKINYRGKVRREVLYL